MPRVDLLIRPRHPPTGTGFVSILQTLNLGRYFRRRDVARSAIMVVANVPAVFFGSYLLLELCVGTAR